MADETKTYCDIHCQEVFLSKSMAMRAMWALLGIGLTMVGSSVTYAISNSAAVARVEQQVKTNGADIERLKGIEAKLDAILATATANNQILSGRVRPIP